METTGCVLHLVIERLPDLAMRSLLMSRDSFVLHQEKEKVYITP
jgi:hypothetical protein